MFDRQVDADARLLRANAPAAWTRVLSKGDEPHSDRGLDTDLKHAPRLPGT